MEKLNALYRPTLLVTSLDASQCLNDSCNVTYNLSYNGFGIPDSISIALYIRNKTLAQTGGNPIVRGTNGNFDRKF